MLRGNYAARIDDKGRLKIPNAFRALVEDQHGTGVFVTSVTGEYVRIYPMPVWLALEEKLGEGALDPSGTPQVLRPGELLRTNGGVRHAGARADSAAAARIGAE